MMHDANFKGRGVKVRQVHPGELTEAQRARMYAAAHRRNLEAESAERLMNAARGNIDDERLMWVIARIPVGQERIALEELRARKIAVWCPMACERRNPKRGQKAIIVERAMFTGYLFLRLPWCPEAWVGAGIAGRVSGYLGNDGVPAKIPARVINTLMIKVKSPEVAKLVPRVRVGMQAIIENGPFASFETKIKRVMRGHGRAEVELDIFGRATVMEIDLDQLKV